MSNRKTAILMATYNGRQYIAEQIDSLLAQTDKDWTLYIHDDGSKDGTQEIINEYARKHENIVALDFDGGNGAKENFFKMLYAVDADYYMFCDQDDVWLPDKVEKTRAFMDSIEKKHPEMPIVVFTDLQVVDKDLKMKAPSFFNYSGVHPQFLHTFADCAATPFTTGCTMMFNEKAKKCVVYPAPQANMHDEWITLCVLRNGGKAEALMTQTILYRQHEGNTFGAVGSKNRIAWEKLGKLEKVWQANKTRYQMLATLGYGSPLKFAYYKLKYKILTL